MAAPKKRSKRLPVYPPGAIAKIRAKDVIDVMHDSRPGDVHNSRYRRETARLYYISNPNKPTILEMSRHELFNDVSIRTLEQWSKDDSWVQGRQETNERVRSLIEAEIGTHLAKARINQLGLMQDIYEDAIDKIKELEPTSYEGTLNALVKLAAFLDDQRERLGDQLVPKSFDSEVDVVDVHHMSVGIELDEEMTLKGVKYLIKLEREKSRRRSKEMKSGGE